jgi:hypothetical protein
MEYEPKNEAVATSETAERIAELKQDIDVYVLVAEQFPTLEQTLLQICGDEFSDLEDPAAYKRVEEYHELIGSGTSGELREVSPELRRSILYQIDLFLDGFESED